MDCIFCRIVAGEIPSYRIAENETTLAFLDIEPAAKGHALVISKQHAADLLDSVPADLAAVAQMVQQVARQIDAALQPDGINILQNNRPAAGQVVMHYHVHILPRWDDDAVMQAWRPKAPAGLDMNEIAAQIRDAAR
ncbi:MAG TPA: HIT family protein [Herpetosiphonaceae bacterium]|nr:HIT family protein [Herpetosiphonaceae bacterium]